MVAMVVETEEYISLTEAAEILSVDRTSLWRQCRAGKISCREVPCKNSPSGKTYEIPKKYVFQKGLNIEEKKSEEPIDIQKKIDALNLPPIEAERLKATLGSFSKAEAEKVLKAEQALAKTKDNVLRDGFYIERSKVAEQVGYVFSNFSHSLKDLITIWQKIWSGGEPGILYDDGLGKILQNCN